MRDHETITIGLQIACVRDEIGRREKEFPKLVSSQKMRKSEADLGIAAMKAVLETLSALRRGSDEPMGAQF